MRKLLILFIFFPFLSIAQLKLAGKVVDAITKEPLPYVNIEHFKSQNGTQSNQDGLFALSMSSWSVSDTLKISCLGYADKIITDLKTSENLIFELIPSVLQLEEVVVKKRTSIEKTLGIINEKGKVIPIFNQLSQVPGVQRAVLMQHHGGVSYLKSVHFFIGKELYNAPFRVRIYKNEHSKPGEDLLAKSIVLQGYKKNAWNSFDMKAYHILVPENGFWVAIEYIANENYAAITAPINIHNADGTIENGVTQKYYGPQILEKLYTNYGITYQKRLGTKWGKTSVSISSSTQSKLKKFNVDLMVRATIEVYD